MHLNTLRKQIDRLDQRLLKLLNDRTRLVAAVGKVKQAKGQSVFAPEREELLLHRLETLNRGPLGNAALRAIYREIISSSRASQKQLVVGCLEDGTGRVLQAARSRFGACDRYQPVASLKEGENGLRRGRWQVLVVPWVSVVSFLAESETRVPLAVCGEVRWRHGRNGGKTTWEPYFLVSLQPPPSCVFSVTAVLFPRGLGKQALRILPKNRFQGRCTPPEVKLSPKSLEIIYLKGDRHEKPVVEFLQRCREEKLRFVIIGSYPITPAVRER